MITYSEFTSVIVTGLIDPVNGNITGNTVVMFGDSFTYGTGAFLPGKRFSTWLCEDKGWTEDNKGVGAECMIKYAPNPFTSMQDRLTEIPTKTADLRYLFISYGLNDVGCNFDGWTVDLFETQFMVVINNAISKGWKKNNMIISGIFYVSTTFWDQYSAYGVTNIANDVRYQLFRQKVLSFSSFVTIVDPYQWIIDNGGDALMNGVGGHPGNLGHQKIGEYFIANLK
jgi:hypothetical protein